MHLPKHTPAARDPRHFPPGSGRIVTPALAAVVLGGLAAQAQDTDLLNLDLDQLAKVEVNIASVKAKPIREQPGVVSVIRREDIVATGDRDLMDILTRVPGFGFGLDVESSVGPSFRGLWAYEGKTQLIVDGVELNDSLYGTIQVGNHIPADAIEQVGIIRGPGSAMYGGTAELAVVRVTTRGASQNGGYGVVTPSYNGEQFGVHYNAGVGYTQGDWRFSFNGYYADDYRSDREYVALDGARFDMGRDSAMTPFAFNVGAGWKDLDVRVLYDSYRYDDRIDYGAPVTSANSLEFNTLSLSAQYQLQATSWLKLTPKVSYRNQVPWKTESEGGEFDMSANRYTAELAATAELSEAVGLMAGVRYYWEEGVAHEADYFGRDPGTYYDGSDRADYDDVAVYAQCDADLNWLSLTVGGRYEQHSYSGGQFVPRIGLVKAWERFHLKALFNQAFRTPNINVISDRLDLASKLEAETTTAYELEAGYKLAEGVSVVGNLFYMQVQDPLVYTYDPATDAEGYLNQGEVSTYGLEAELRVEQPRWSGYLGYSLYVADQNSVDAWQSGEGSTFPGAPTHKLTASATVHLTRALDWNVNGTLLTERWAYQYPAAGITEYDPELLLNTYVEYRLKGLSLGVGVANLLDEDRWIPQPFDGGSGPMPLKGREIYAKVGYRF